MEILRLKKVFGKSQALTAQIDFSRWEVLIPFEGELEIFEDAVQKFNETREIIFERVTPKKSREIEIKSYMAESVRVIEKIGGEILIKFGTKITLEGTIKPSEVLKILSEEFKLNFEVTSAKIKRVALFGRGRNLLD